MVNAVVPILRLYNIYVRNVVVSKSVVHIVCQIPDGRRLRRCNLCSGRSALLQEWEAVTTPFQVPLCRGPLPCPPCLSACHLWCRFGWEMQRGWTDCTLRSQTTSQPSRAAVNPYKLGWALSQSPGPLVVPWLLLSMCLDAYSPEPFQ